MTAQTAGAVDVSREGSVATVLLSRPDKLNAFGVEMASAIADAIEAALGGGPGSGEHDDRLGTGHRGHHHPRAWRHAVRAGIVR